MSDIISDILHVFQVAKLVRLLKHKPRLDNAYFKTQDLMLSCLPTSGTRTPRYTSYQYNIIYDIVSDIIPDIGYHSDRIYVH
jgi:hypothetical protein